MRGKPSGEWETTRRYAGYPFMTVIQRDILLLLRDRPHGDYLIGVHGRAINSLLSPPREWIALLGTRYRASYDGELNIYGITDLGRHVLELYLKAPLRRGDGICPHCGKAPRHVSKNGNQWGYCRKCQNKINAANQYHTGKKFKPDHLCPRCKIRPHHVSPNGKVYHSYCAPCFNEIQAERKQPE